MKPPIDNFKLSKYPNGSVTQWFGENPDLYKQWGLAYHNGIDIVAPWNSPMYAVESGTIINIKDDPNGYGRHIRFISNKEHEPGIYREWTYGHCEKILKNVGDKVKAGEQIATMGNTGFVVSGATPFWKHNPYAGTHLHLGLRLVKQVKNGWSYPGSSIKLKTLNYDNGVKGAIDPYNLLVKKDGDSYRQKQLTIISLLNQVVDLYGKLLAKQVVDNSLVNK